MLFPFLKPMLRCICVLLAVLPLAGCWSKEEFNDRAFVTLMLVDRTPSGLTELSIGFFLPNRLAPGQGQPMSKEKPFALVNRTGRDLAEAYQHVQKEVPRKVTWGALRVIIVSGAYAEHGLQPLLDFILRISDIRLKAFLYQINGKAQKVGGITPIFERFPSEIIREFSHMELLPCTTIKDVLYAHYNYGDSFIPQLSLTDKKMNSENQKVGSWLGTKGAVLIRNGKQTAEFTREQTRGIQWMTEKVKNMILTFASPTDGKPISIRIANLKQTLTIEQADDRIDVHIGIQSAGDLISTESSANLSDLTVLTQIQQAAADQIKTETMDVLKQTIAHHADLFHIGNQILWKYPELWKRIKDHWRDYYAEHTDFHAEVELRLQRFGGIKQPVLEGDQG
ncbi:Ger(x)C family spore germination protein [Paenibacillus rigui]|uniref:Uncharacterized protein n=1 Tax=Paenibacillus rigui TaxID=554312 RepID=A0A229UP30_9BACL|nr:Ger(x)C family spore germination protein [Paenibacillus rigui]OXM85138.1 hypothetical protein CF651_16150 [Paenibacillus rigui]